MTIAGLQKQEEQMLFATTTFRKLLDSVTRPGKLKVLAAPDFLGTPPGFYSKSRQETLPVNLYGLGTLLTLLDTEVGFSVAANGQWLEPSHEVVRWVALRSGAKLTSPDKANFAFFCDGLSQGLLSQLDQGNMLEPELSATAVYCVKSLLPHSVLSSSNVNGWLELELAGPGIENSRTVSVAGLDEKEIQLIQASRQHYPLGIDLFFVDNMGQCLGLPRSTKLKLVKHPVESGKS